VTIRIGRTTSGCHLCVRTGLSKKRGSTNDCLRSVFPNTIGLLIILTANVAYACSAIADDPHLGITEYEIACMSSHGVDGRGDGRLARTLKTAPADLTQIAKSNGGTFPLNKVEEIVDGRAPVAAHGDRDMPVWGIGIACLSRARIPHGSNGEFAPKFGRSPTTSNRFRKNDPFEQSENLVFQTPRRRMSGLGLAERCRPYYIQTDTPLNPGSSGVGRTGRGRLCGRRGCDQRCNGHTRRKIRFLTR
jgi:hypothetical protein